MDIFWQNMATEEQQEKNPCWAGSGQNSDEKQESCNKIHLTKWLLNGPF